MKNSVGFIVSSLFIIFMIILCVNIINVFSVINKANAYHQTCIAEIQSSNFSSEIISKYTEDTVPFETEIIDRTVKNENDNLERTGRIYEVVTTYEISIPVINYEITQTIQGYAR